MEATIKLKKKIRSDTLTDFMVGSMLISYQLYSFFPILANILKIVIPSITLLTVLKRNNFKLVKNLSIFWLYIFIGISMFSFFVTISISETASRLLAMLSLALFIITLSQYIVKKNDLNKVINCLVYGAFL